MTTGPDFQLQPVAPEHLPEVAVLLRHLWSADAAVNQRVFAWKYLENPQRSATPGIVALRDGRVVGFRGYFVACLVAPGTREPLRILCPGDICVDPSCRRAGLSVAMGRLASQHFAGEFPLFLNTSTTHASLPGYRKLGFLPLADKAYLSAYRRLDLARYLRVHAARPSAPSGRIRFCEEADFVASPAPRPEDMAAVASRPREPWPGLSPWRSAEYFHWRFRNPQRTYVFYYAYAGGEPRGYVVLGLSPNLRRGYVLDFADVDGASAAALLARILGRRDVDILSIATASRDSASVDWRALGFKATGLLRLLERRRTGELPLLVRPVAAEFGEQHWRLAGLDVRDIRHWQYREMLSDAF